MLCRCVLHFFTLVLHVCMGNCRLWPEHASSYNNLASVVDNSSLSYTLYHEALVHNPSHSAAHFNLAVLRQYV